LTAALAWSCFAHVDLVAVASGKVVPLGRTKVVQPLETSAIRAIYVDDGDHVTAGEVLVELDPTDVTTDLAAQRYDMTQAALDAEVARLLLTKNPEEAFRMPAGVDPALAEANHQLAVISIKQYLAKVAEAEADVAQKEATIEAGKIALDRAKQTLPLLEEKNDTTKTLLDHGFGTRATERDTLQQAIEARAALSSAGTAQHQASADLESSKAKLLETEAAYASSRRTAALQKLATLEEAITKLTQRESYRHLVAPVSGTVQDVKIHTPGAVVTTADTLMSMVPDGTGLEVEAMVEKGDIGFVREGEEVEVKLDAFPFIRYGLIKGRVRKLARDAAVSPVQTKPGDPATAAPAPLVYAAKVTLDRDWIDTETGRKTIQPGMRVAAEIKTGDRLAIDYLLSPVLQTLHDSAHER
jgi:hemolysin D